MNYLAITVAFCVFLTAMGKVVDALLNVHEKSRLQDALVRLWNRVDEAPVSDSVALTMIWVRDKALAFLGGRIFSIRSLTLVLFCSIVLTTLLCRASAFIRYPSIARHQGAILPAGHVLCVNAILDLATLAVTLGIMSKVKRNRPVRNLVCVSADVVIALLLWVFTLGSVSFFSTILAKGAPLPGSSGTERPSQQEIPDEELFVYWHAPERYLVPKLSTGNPYKGRQLQPYLPGNEPQSITVRAFLDYLFYCRGAATAILLKTLGDEPLLHPAVPGIDMSIGGVRGPSSGSSAVQLKVLEPRTLGWLPYIVSGTTCIPTICYLSLAFVLLLAKAVQQLERDEPVG